MTAATRLRGAASSGLIGRLRKVLLGARGRPIGMALLLFMLSVNFLSERPRGFPDLHPRLAAVVERLAAPLTGARTLLFDSYQRLHPRQPDSQPAVIVAIDEATLASQGQWPWPRDRLAKLVELINKQQPAAIGMEIFMPEPDQSSAARLADRLSGEGNILSTSQFNSLVTWLSMLPDNEAILADTLRQAPVVLGMSGLDDETQGSLGFAMNLVSPTRESGDPRPYMRRFPRALASLATLQAAAKGQAALNIESEGGTVRRFPMVVEVAGSYASSMPIEMLRIGTDSPAPRILSGSQGVMSVVVADLSVPTQPEGDLWVHFAPFASGQQRTVSAIDVLQGKVPPDIFSGKLVFLGLTAAGLGDMRHTPLGEVVPSLEIQAQVTESIFDGRFLMRPWWMKTIELALIGLLCFGLVWFVPRTDSRVAAVLRDRPQISVGITLAVCAAMLGTGVWLFIRHGLLFDGASLSLMLVIIMGVLIASALIQGLGEARGRLARLVDSGIALGRQRDRDQLLRQTLLAAQEMSRCQAATLLLKTERNTLRFALRTGPEPLPQIELSLKPSTQGAEDRFATTECVLAGSSIVIDDIRTDKAFNHQGLHDFGRMSGKEVVSVMVVPLSSGEGSALGAIQMINAEDPQTGRVVPFDRKMVSYMEALAAQAAVAIDNRNLLAAQEALMDSMIKILAGAIDAKSAYTGGHCERVPELGIMLAQEACKVTEGPLASFEFKTADEWREFRIGAWLHDCGKVTTPEFVVDKATKLETIYDRIHEGRMRFEVLLRDADNERLRDVLEGRASAEQALAQFEQRKAQLLDDFAFVAECNLGGEFMAPERKERLRRIGDTVWMRHFDDRMGVGHEELKRHEREPRQALPAAEKLLADKARHLFERPANAALDPKYGFKLKVPEYLYNQGEIYNLSVGRGTLTEEDRFKINEHIIQTIVMLEQMPLPPNLKRVPEYAGTHHETLDGSGYPRRLGAEELSVPSRIMAIADIFEALTASDRPYKKAKTLSDSVKMLAHFRDTHHVDADLFELFLSSGVYRRYAEKYLKPEQIDEVDISKYLKRTAAAH